jgi:uncharacterized protein (TIGR02453 family)
MRVTNEGFPPPPFEGFPSDALAFFRELSANMDKAWFTANKARYESHVRDPMQALVGTLSQELHRAGLPIDGDPKRSVVRIYRDVRFSRHKTPYKTNAACVLARGGDRTAPGVFYFQLDPLGSFAAAGFHAPDRALLHRMRLRIVEDPKGWAKVVAALAKGGLELSQDDTLVRLPRGFDHAPPELFDALRLKSWVVTRVILDKELANASLTKTLLRLVLDAEPLLRFGWLALDRHASADIPPSRARR